MKKEKPEKQSASYRFDAPIRITAYKPGGLDILFYSTALGILVAALIFLLFYRGGHFALEFTLGRTLLSIPLLVICSFIFSLLRELWVYPKKLLKKSVWTLEEMMKLTGKNQKDTQNIMTRVLESSFIVDPACMKQDA